MSAQGSAPVLPGTLCLVYIDAAYKQAQQAVVIIASQRRAQLRKASCIFSAVERTEPFGSVPSKALRFQNRVFRYSIQLLGRTCHTQGQARPEAKISKASWFMA